MAAVPSSGVGGNGTASEFGDLTGMSRQEVDEFLRGLGANVSISELGYNVYHPEDVRELEADLFGIHLGEDAHRKPAEIHTDIFEISILYGSFRVEKRKREDDASDRESLPLAEVKG